MVECHHLLLSVCKQFRQLPGVLTRGIAFLVDKEVQPATYTSGIKDLGNFVFFLFTNLDGW
jgi:hypothetical protein